MEKERIDHQVLNSIFSGTEPDRNTLAKYQIRLAAFFGISVYKCLIRWYLRNRHRALII
jgi:hypothetical protein